MLQMYFEYVVDFYELMFQKNGVKISWGFQVKYRSSNPGKNEVIIYLRANNTREQQKN